jgi:putative mycofactocin binding protein MftB
MTESASVLDRPLELAPEVSVRPERFGALLYHFGSRRLSFLKDPRLLAVVQRLPDVPTARAACADSGVERGSVRSFEIALDRLLETGMLRERSA